MENFVDYNHAIASIALTALLGLLLSPLVAIAKLRKGVAAGGSPTEDYDDRLYRFNRAYLNLTENIGFLVAAALAAILAGASSSWVNWLASIFFVSRLLHLFVHTGFFGPMNFGPRTFVYTIGWACSGLLAILAIVAVF